MTISFNNVALNRVGVNGGRSGLLDRFPGAAAAYSLRRLSDLYSGSAIRVRRASDSAEQDIGFSGNDLDTASLTSFCTGTDGFVTTWYDQSGNTNNATQATTTAQPKVYDSSAGTVLVNSKAAIDFDGIDDTLLTPIVPTGPLSTFAAFEGNSAANGSAVFGGRDGTATSYVFQYQITTWKFRVGGNNTSVTTTLANDLVGSFFIDGTTLQWYANGASQLSEAQVSPLVNTTHGISLMAWNLSGSPSFFYAGYKREWIIYASDQISNRTSIESNIATYYGITLS